jgi:hypothetical protein
MERRQLEQAMGRWRDSMNDERKKEDGATTVLRRVKTRLFRKAFDLYREGVELRKREDLHISRMKMFLNTTDQRRMEECFNGIKLFVQRHMAAKEYWRKLDFRLNNARQKQGFKRW